MGRMSLVLVAGVIIFAGGVYWGANWLAPWTESQEAARLVALAQENHPKANLDVTALGRLEPVGGVLQVAGTAGERVSKLLVAEGETVAADQELAYLSSHPIYQAEYANALSSVKDLESQQQAAIAHADQLIAEASLAIPMTGEPLDLEIQMQESQIALLEANLEAARKERRRLSTIGRDIVAPQQVDQQDLIVKRAEVELHAAQIQLASLKATLPLRRKQAQAQLNSAQATKEKIIVSMNVDSARRVAESARLRMEQAVIRAPRDGQVLKILVSGGESLGGQPILHLGNLQHMQVLAEIYESDVSRVAPGQKVTITSHALPEPLHGEVEALLWTVAGNNLRSLNPLAPVDLRVVETRIRLLDAEVKQHKELLSRLINLQVDVQIHVATSPVKQGNTPHPQAGQSPAQTVRQTAQAPRSTNP